MLAKHVPERYQPGFSCGNPEKPSVKNRHARIKMEPGGGEGGGATLNHFHLIFIPLFPPPGIGHNSERSEEMGTYLYTTLSKRLLIA